MEYDIRPATLADVPAVLDMLNIVERAESGSSDWTAEMLREQWTDPHVDLARDGFVAWAGDVPIAYGGVSKLLDAPRVQSDHYVLPGEKHWPAGRAILDRIVTRTAAIASSAGLSEIGLSMGQMVGAPFAASVFPAAGWQVARQFARMVRPLSEADAVPVPLPEGLSLRTVRDDADRRAYHRIAAASFAEHWGSDPIPFETLMARVANSETNDWSLWWVATLHGDDVGCLRSRPWPDAGGFIDTLGVLKPARGRGIGSALLKASFAEFASRACRRVELMVDTENVTGAWRLYESVGMAPAWQADIWERTVAAA